MVAMADSCGDRYSGECFLPFPNIQFLKIPYKQDDAVKAENEKEPHMSDSPPLPVKEEQFAGGGSLSSSSLTADRLESPGPPPTMAKEAKKAVKVKEECVELFDNVNEGIDFINGDCGCSSPVGVSEPMESVLEGTET